MKNSLRTAVLLSSVLSFLLGLSLGQTHMLHKKVQELENQDYLKQNVIWMDNYQPVKRYRDCYKFNHKFEVEQLKRDLHELRLNTHRDNITRKITIIKEKP